jgi:chorismate lyase/3-hydroxybenzoate synthase
MPDPSARETAGSELRVEYAAFDPQHHLDRDVLAAIVFGEGTPRAPDPRCVRVALEPRFGRGLAEIWHGRGPVQLGRRGPIHYAEDGAHLMAWMEVDDDGAVDFAEPTERAYRTLLDFQARSPYRHVWRVWNFMAGINAGAGDAERYKRFCLGRAHALSGASGNDAIAVGTVEGGRSLQVCWLAGTAPGQPLENPRQVSAYRYPRQYGPAAPQFSRAMLTPAGVLLVSGTASIVGHGSVHAGDAAAQLEETLRNIDALIDDADRHLRAAGRRARSNLLLKVFLRPPLDPGVVEQRLRRHFGPDTAILVLDAEICRTELLLEIEAIR